MEAISKKVKDIFGVHSAEYNPAIREEANPILAEKSLWPELIYVKMAIHAHLFACR
jgi:hypothetical protein